MRVVRLRTEIGTFTAIMGEPGRIYTPFAIIELPVIRKRKIPNGDVKLYVTDINYPIKKACNRFLKFGKKHSITKGARTFIKEAWA